MVQRPQPEVGQWSGGGRGMVGRNKLKGKRKETIDIRAGSPSTAQLGGMQEFEQICRGCRREMLPVRLMLEKDPDHR